ncbi:MAG: hypothetical protein P1V51_03505 [Deltaproteobacteria bacterium]|nr:hypothetical protein [Deltaproteobacteria bacterium]
MRRLASILACLGLLACADPNAPVVEATALGDTRDPLGPYAVAVVVRENREIAAVRLSFRSAEAATAEVLLMEDRGDGRFTGEIPGYPAGAELHWFVEAEDGDGNFGYAPWQAEYGDASCVDALGPEDPLPEGGAAYCFSVLP